MHIIILLQLGSWSDLVDNVNDISNNNVESLWDDNNKVLYYQVLKITFIILYKI